MKKTLSIDLIDRNKGQIEGVHGNPRFIKDSEFDKLVNSIKEDASFLDHRGLLVFPYKGRFVTVGGNMRFEACKAVGMTEVTCEILPEETTSKKLNDYIILDNASFGQWDFDELANFDADILDRYNIEIPQIDLTPEEEPTEAEEDNYEVPDEVKTDIVVGDLFEIKCHGLTHRLICGDSTNAEHVDKLMAGKKADALITDPPYNVDYGAKGKLYKEKGGYECGMSDRKILNDNMSDENFRIFLRDVFKQGARVLKPGGAFYVYHASKEVLNFVGAIVENGLLYKQMLVWVKNSMTLGRQDYQWRHEPCQKPGTMITMEGGIKKPIEQIVAGDRVVGLHRPSLQLVGWNKSGTGKKVTGATSREYDGNIYHVRVGEIETNATDNHIFTVRYNKEESAKYFVYLMKKGDKWRIGISQLRNSRGSGMRDRLRGEQADAMWVVSNGYETKIDAQIQETILGLRYGIPQTIWNTGKSGRICGKNEIQIDRIYNELGIEWINEGAKRLLGDRINYPQIQRYTGKESTVSGFTVEACNLIPKAYEVLMPHKASTGTIIAQYQQIEEIKTEKYKGIVYSLAVEGKHYISDGMVTHNCLYGWKEGASHYFTNNRSLTTVIEDQIDIEKLTKAEMRDLLTEMLSDTATPQTIIREDKPLRNGEHPTMKPVKLIGRNVYNSTRIYEIVLDLFMGSGSTLIAGHQLKRNVYGAELDPKYCQVILDRFRKLEPECEIRKIEENDTKTTN